MTTTKLLAIGFASLLGIAACSSDDKGVSKTTSDPSDSTVETAAGSDETAATANDDTVSIPDISGLPGELGDCGAYLTAFTGALSGQQTADGQDLETVFGSLVGNVPPELDAAVEVLAEDFGTLQALYEKYNYDYTKIATDPEFQALFSDTEFTNASNQVSEWFNAGCPTS